MQTLLLLGTQSIIDHMLLRILRVASASVFYIFLILDPLADWYNFLSGCMVFRVVPPLGDVQTMPVFYAPPQGGWGFSGQDPPPGVLKNRFGTDQLPRGQNTILTEKILFGAGWVAGSSLLGKPPGKGKRDWLLFQRGREEKGVLNGAHRTGSIKTVFGCHVRLGHGPCRRGVLRSAKYRKLPRSLCKIREWRF